MEKGEVIKIRYTGSRFPKVIELPIPYAARSEKTGEIVFDQANLVREFPAEDGQRLLEISGEDGPFQLEEDEKKTRTRPSAFLSKKEAEKYRDRFAAGAEIEKNDKGFWEIKELSAVTGTPEG